MLHLNFAPSLDLLAPRLREKLRNAWVDPFTPPVVIVPSPAAGRWLQMKLSAPDTGDGPHEVQKPGCVANLQMPTLERYLWSILQPDETMQMLHGQLLSHVVCALLEPDLLALESCAALKTYLQASADGGPDSLKRVQLANAIAHQFLEYEYNRPSVWIDNAQKWKSGLDASWIGGRSYHTDEHEPWQRELYVRAARLLNSGGTDGAARYISLPHLYRLRREHGLPGGARWTVAPGALFLFDVTKISHFHRNMLVEISQMPGVDMEVFLTNPCAEFWEDIDTRRNRTSRRSWNWASARPGIAPRSSDEYGRSELLDFANLPADHALLELWGNAGKENIFLWCPQAQWHFDYDTPAWIESDTAPDTLLRALQYSLLRGMNELPAREGGWQSDGSLQVLACPDRGREIEEIREMILDLVHCGSLDRLNEVVVYMPDPGIYLAHIQRVFGATRPGDCDYIPFTILGVPGGTGMFAQGMQLFLELCEGRFDRAAVMALLRNPVVQATRAIDPQDAAVWESWAEALGIYRGWNREHRSLMGDLGEAVTDAHTFELGIARLLTGMLAAGPVDMAFDLHSTPGTGERALTAIPPYRDFNTGSKDLVEGFCAVVEELYHDTALLRECIGTGVNEGVEQLLQLVWKWFGELPDDPSLNPGAEGRMLRSFAESVPQIRIQSAVAGRTLIPLREFLALARECIPRETPAVSAAWTGGVTFAPLRPAMIVPARVLFVAGLDAAAFPGTNEKPGWDLLSRRRIVGDSDRVRDNRFAFLDLLHAARERLILSFRARDMQREEELHPSSVVLELEAYLCAQGIEQRDENGALRCAIRRRVPWIVHESFDEICTAGRVHGSWNPDDLELAAAASQEPPVRHRHDLCAEKDLSSVPASVQKKVQTSWADLRVFFRNPLEYHLQKTLGIDLDDEPDTLGATDEPFESGPREMSALQQRIFIRVLQAVFPASGEAAAIDINCLSALAQEAAAGAHRDHLVRGAAPEAQLGAMEEQYLVNWARSCAEASITLREQYPDHMLVQNIDTSLGDITAAAGVQIRLPEGEGALVQCRHALVLMPRRGSASAAQDVGIIGFKKEGNAAENPDLWLACLVQWLAMKDESDRRRITMIQFNRGEKQFGFSTARMKGVCDPPHDIESWFGELLDSMLLRNCSDHFPCAVIADLTRQNKRTPRTLAERWAAVTREGVEERLSLSEHGYTSFIQAFKYADARMPDLDDAGLQALARVRFAPMVEGWVHE